MQKQDLIYRKQYMQQLRNLKDQNIINHYWCETLREVNTVDDVCRRADG